MSLGRGRGRGRGLLKVLQEQERLGQQQASPGGCGDAVDGSILHKRTVLMPLVNGFNRVKEGDFNGNCATSQVRPKVKVSVRVPDRLIDQNVPIPATVLSVDVEQKCAFVKFEDDLTLKLWREFEASLNKYYTHPETSVLRLTVEDLVENEIIVVRDIFGNYHRAIVPQETDYVTMKDVDTNDVFQIDRNAIFKITPEMCELFFQVVKCEVCLDTASRHMEHWIEENGFILKQSKLLNSCVLSALEMVPTELIRISRVQRTAEDDKLRIFIDVLESELLKSHFLSSLIFFTIPRLSEVGGTKTAVITNVRDDGDVDIVFNNNVCLKLREAIAQLHYEKQLIIPRCEFMLRYLREMIQGFNVRNFLAPLNGDWNELHRVKVVDFQSCQLFVKVLYMDIGKVATIPLRNLATPVRCNEIPELLEFVPPQAVTLRLKGLKEGDASALRSLKATLEGKPCYVKTVNDADIKSPPLVEIWTDIDNQVVSLVDFLHKKDGSKSEESELANAFSAENLKGIMKKLEIMKGRGMSEASAEVIQRLNSINGAGEIRCECCCYEDGFEINDEDL